MRKQLFLFSSQIFLITVLAKDSFRLEAFSDCDALLSYYQQNALRRIDADADRPPIIPFGQPEFGVVAASAEASMLAAPASESAPVAGSDFSGTNVQVAGVEEPDIVKTDGRRVFYLRNDRLYYIKAGDSVGAGPGSSAQFVDSLRLPTYGKDILLYEDTVLVIAFEGIFLAQPNVFRSNGSSNAQTQDASSPHVASNPRKTNKSIQIDVAEETFVYKVRVTEEGALYLVETLRFQGRYVSARAVGNRVRLISTYIPYYANFPLRFNETIEEDKKRREQYINNSKLSDWTPGYISSPGGTSVICSGDCTSESPTPLKGDVNPLARCDNTFRPTEGFGGYALLTVSTLSFDGKFEPTGTESIVSDGEDIYATKNSLYVSTSRYQNDLQNDLSFLPSTFRTSFHKFSLEDESVEYIASGSITGSLLNQFSMHEDASGEAFFVATTEGAPWWSARDTSRSKVTSFVAEGGQLRPVGSVEDLGVGERIYAVRYIGKTAYVVTFRQVDPLYVIDIADPRAMVLKGELKIPGFSAYLHPVGEGRILGVGRDATPEGVLKGAKVSLFDVSEPQKPKEVSMWTVPNSVTAAQFDHRAFLFWSPLNIAVMPIADESWNPAGRFVGAVVLDVDEGGITLRGNYSHPSAGFSGEYSKILRNFILGKDNIWSVSSDYVQVNKVKDLKTVAVVSL